MFFVLLFFTFSLKTNDSKVILDTKVPWYGSFLFDQIFTSLSDFSLKTAKQFYLSIYESNSYKNEEIIIETLKNLVDDFTFSMIQSEIEVKSLLPRIEYFREKARSFGGSNYADLIFVGSQKPSFLQNNENYSFYQRENFIVNSYDFFSNGNRNTVPDFIVYANLSNPETFTYIYKLLTNEDIKECFIVRPTSQDVNFGVQLRGFGFELRPFKYSMEYKVKNTENTTENIDSAKEEKLASYSDETISLFSDNQNNEMKEDSSESMSYKIADFINENLKYKSLPAILRDISSNRALIMDLISEENLFTKQNDPGYQELKSISEAHTKLNKALKNKIILNNRIIDDNETDIFSLLELLKKEKNINNILQEHINNSDVEHLLTSSKLPSKEQIRFNWRSKHIAFYNDLENDALYKNWPNSTTEFLNLKKTIPRAKKNLLNVVLYINPISDYGINELFLANTMIQKGIPVRLGIHPIFDMRSQISRQVAFAFQYIKDHNQKSAFTFLTRIATFTGFNRNTGRYNPITPENVAKAYQLSIRGIKGALNWNQIYKLYSPKSSKYYNLVKESQEFIINSEIEPRLMSVNGKIIPADYSFMFILNMIWNEAEVISALLKENSNIDNPLTFDDSDVMQLYKEQFYLTKTLNSGISNEHINSLHLYSQPHFIQIQYLDFLQDIEFKNNFNPHTNENNTEFCIYITDSDENKNKFSQFFENNLSHVAYATIAHENPKFTKELKELFNDKSQDNDKPTNHDILLVNGRLFNNFVYDEKRLIEITQWTHHIICNTYYSKQNIIKQIPRHALYYIYSLITEWQEDNIMRSNNLEKEIFEHDKLLTFSSNDKNSKKILMELEVNPLDSENQEIIHLANYLYEKRIIDLNINIILPSNYSNIDLSFYRTALDSDFCSFGYLNKSVIYSAIPKMPNAWVVESLYASCDMDNIIYPEHIQKGSYILTNIIAEGFTQTTENIQLHLVNDFNEIVGGTSVINYGYWQFQANPGHFKVELGREPSLYYTVIKNDIVVDGFATNNKKILFKRLSPFVPKINDNFNTDRVDVFSTCSGHLYERLTKIMMLSVRKQSKYNVKFWILKNFLSPSFKASLPSMSERYNFTYELVSYNWPKWLYKQSEKQRIIWGNKILFLDVLFPPELERVIYIDSDQIVRTDLNELMRMNFHGAPYAFTPMCNSRVETEPYRFWKTGYWKEHLRNKPYHISALFAIDLNRFRAQGAGNILRTHYNGLAPDPDSLANLDQDLPNYLQNTVPIYSLPQEWLWCETWCSDETMDKAKTIDLCNNPLTHVSKLDIAKERVKEWPALDEEARTINSDPTDFQNQFFKPSMKEN